MKTIAANRVSRRAFIKAAATASIGTSLNPLSTFGDQETSELPKGNAGHCIFIWLGGGACHIDMWDPKRKGDGKKLAGSAYEAIDTAIPGVQVTEHLAHCARILDRFVLLRTVNHDVTDEHAAATNRLHTGRPTSGTVIYPSIDRKSVV